MATHSCVQCHDFDERGGGTVSALDVQWTPAVVTVSQLIAQMKRLMLQTAICGPAKGSMQAAPGS